MTNSEPVIARAFEEARNTTAAATSSGSIHGHGKKVARRSFGNFSRCFPFEHGQPIVHRRVDARWAQADDPDVIGSQLDGPRSGQADESPFGRRVMREPGHTAQAGHR